MSRASAALVLILAGCGQSEAPAKGEAITCALNGTVAFVADCRAERVSLEGRQGFIVHHPDGGFRRLLLSADGQSVEAADGADAAQSALKGDRFEVIVGADRYVIPAKADAAAR